jgi:mono/diheme cytochrome c family protein
MTKSQSIMAGIACIYLLAAACTKKQAEEFKPETPEIPEAKVSYAATVNPIFQAKCAGCHSPGRSGTVAWTFAGFSSVTASAERIRNAVVVTRFMPLNGSLSAAELQSVRDWFDQGMQP